MIDLTLDRTQETQKVQTALYQYFIDHPTQGATPTPAEWLAAATDVALDALMKDHDAYVNAVEQVRIDAEENDRQIRIESRQQTIKDLMASLESFVASEPLLGDLDKADVPGVARALSIIKQELA